MTVLLRLLPLLVVGCLLLQSLQPTAANGEEFEICEQTIEGEAIAFEDYVWEYGKSTKKPGKKVINPVKKVIKKRIQVSYNYATIITIVYAHDRKTRKLKQQIA